MTVSNATYPYSIIRYARLNVYVPQYVYVETLTPSVTVSEGGAFGG